MEPETSSGTIPGKKKHGKGRGAIRIIVRLVSVILLLPALLIAVLGVQFATSIESPRDHIPADNRMYLIIPDLAETVLGWLDLDAVQILVREVPGLSDMNEALGAFKSGSIRTAWWFQFLDHVSAHAFLDRDGKPAFVMDLGWRSMFTRHLWIAGGVIPLDGLQMIQEQGQWYYRYALEGDQAMYLGFKNNLCIAALDKDMLFRLMDPVRLGNPLSLTPESEAWKEFRTASGERISFLVDSRSAIDGFASDPGLKTLIQDTCTFTDHSLASLRLDNDALQLDARFWVHSQDPAVSRVMDAPPSTAPALHRIPGSARFVADWNLADFRTLTDLWVRIAGDEAKDLLSRTDEAARLILGMGMDDLIYSWTSREAGMVLLGDMPDPVFFLSVQDDQAREKVFRKLSDNALVDVQDSLVLDGITLGRISFPDFLKGILSFGGIELPEPWFLLKDHILWLSMSPAALVRLDQESRQGSRLLETQAYRDLQGDVPDSPALSLYWDIGSGVPDFLEGDTPFHKIWKLYNRGYLALSHGNGTVDCRLGMSRVRIPGAVSFPGFPKAIGLRPSENPVTATVNGRPVMTIMTKSGAWSAFDLLAGKVLRSGAQAPGTRLAGMQGEALLLLEPDGCLYKMDLSRESEAVSPLLTPFRGLLMPVLDKDTLWGIPAPGSALGHFDSGRGWISTDTLPEAPVLSGIVRGNDSLFFADKDFTPRVYRIRLDSGKPAEGWPAEADGMTVAPPAWYGEHGNGFLCLASQAGLVQVWDGNGRMLNGFPLQLPAPVLGAPAFLHRKDLPPRIIVLDQEGTLYQIGLEGVVLDSRHTRARGKDWRLSTMDWLAEGNDQIYAWGGGNNVWAWDAGLKELTGFPIQGARAPFLSDVDLNGTRELVTTGIDGTISAWSWGNIQ